MSGERWAQHHLATTTGNVENASMSESVLPSEDRILRYTGELVAYVGELFPMRFYSGEKWWRAHLAAALLRLSEIAESILRCLPDRRDLDAAAALRSMYELAVTVAWILIDPRQRNFLWGGEELGQQLRLHNDLTTFGEALLSSDEVTLARSARGMPSLADRAEAADRHWHAEVPGLHPRGISFPFEASTTRSTGKGADQYTDRSRACSLTSTRFPVGWLWRQLGTPTSRCCTHSSVHSSLCL